MPNAVFDGMPSAFVEAFGESIIYVPISTGLPVGPDGTITAIWNDAALDIQAGVGISVDAGKTTLSVRGADVTPQEDDIVTRVADGKRMVVSTPILPDGMGMIACNLTDCD